MHVIINLFVKVTWQNISEEDIQQKTPICRKRNLHVHTQMIVHLNITERNSLQTITKYLTANTTGFYAFVVTLKKCQPFTENMSEMLTIFHCSGNACKDDPYLADLESMIYRISF